MNEMTLREVCEITGASRRAVQGYEKAGLVTAKGKNKYGYLLYDQDGIERIREIKQFQDFGFSINEIQELFNVPKNIQHKMLLGQLKKMEKQLEKMQSDITLLKNMLQEKKI